MEKTLTITVEEAKGILEMFDALELEFGGCRPLEGRCGQFLSPTSIECWLCVRLRELLYKKGKKE
jgi:hypothetical protein